MSVGKSYKQRLGLAAMASGLMIGCSPMALAQQASVATAAAADQGGVEEIVVTARKREEKLQDVPLDITVISAATLQAQNITRIEDIARFVPGFHVDDTGDRAFNKPFIRGITTSSVEFYQAKVKTFVDGVLIAGDAANSMPFSELKSVEILKGPQSTAFGRGTLGGAISYTTIDPTDYYSGSVSADIREFGYTSFNALLSGPIIPGVLKGYVNLRDYRYEGFLTNSYDGSHLGYESTKYASTKLEYTGSDWLTLKAYGSYDYDRDGVPAFQYQTLSTRTNISTPASLALTGGKPTIAFVGPLIGSDFKSNTYDPYNQMLYPGLRRNSFRGNFTASADLGFATLTSTTAYNVSHEYESYNSIYGLPASQTGEPVGLPSGYALNLPASQRDPDQTSAQEAYQDFQQEFRLTSNNDGPLKWLAGVNYFHYNQFENYPVFAFSQIYKTTSYSAFGSISYDILDNLTVTAEGRYNKDKDGLVANFYHQNFSSNFYRFLPRVSVDYHITPDVSVYALYSEGSSPGFFNANLTGVLAQYTGVQPEYLYNYEAGIKSVWFDRQLRANISVYQEDYKNQQLIQQQVAPNIFYNPNTPGSTQYTLQQIYENAASTKSRGVEVDLTAVPNMVPGLTLHGSAAWTAAKFDNYCSAVQYLITPYAAPAGFSTAPLASGAGYTGCVSVAGHYLQEQPEWMGALGASYKRPLSDTWTLITSADWSYIGRKFLDETNISWTAPSEIVNLHLGVKSENITIDTYVLNATNEDAPAYGKAFANQGFLGSSTNKFAAFTAQGVAQTPRQFGMKVTYDFGSKPEAETTVAYTPPPVVAPAPAAVAHSYQVFFDFNKSDLTPEAVKVVDQAAANAAPAKVTRIDVTGHTDTVGSDAYNMRLSRRRAESVAAELQARGIPSSEIAIFAKGKKDLLVPTADGVREPQNRRVQIVYEGGPNS